VEKVVLKALAKSPDERYASAEDMAAALEQCILSLGYLSDPSQKNGVGQLAGYVRSLFPAEADKPLPETAVAGAAPPPGDKTTPLLPSSPSGPRSRITRAIQSGGNGQPAQQLEIGVPAAPGTRPLTPPSMLAEERTQLDRPGRTRKSFRRRIALGIGFVAGVLMVAGGWLTLARARALAATVAPGGDAAKSAASAEPLPPGNVQPVIDLTAEPPENQPQVTQLPAQRLPKKKGRVALRVNPWAEVYLGSKSLGITPTPPFEMSAGVHTLTLKNPELGVVRKIRVEVPEGREVSVRADLLAP
jgi:serine/threonine-protein kinase